MPNNKQYGCPLFIADLKAGDPIPMKQLHFSRNVSDSAAYNEAWLQDLIMKHPKLLPVEQIEPAFAGLVPICTELQTSPSGYLDNLLVNPDGNIALVECKLWRNPGARREVIGQIIEYAKDLSTWTYDKLEEAISRTKPIDGSDAKKPTSLYEVVVTSGEIDEPSFIDAICRNLRRGRFLLLILGDGIREEIVSMTEFLQQHAGLHFIFGIVELALFELPTGGYVAQSRVLAKTTNIYRGIVTFDDGERVIIRPPATPITVSGSTPHVKMTISKELYLEKLERSFPGISGRLNRFIEKIETYDVLPEFGRDTMILRWRRDDTRKWNLGTIPVFGQVFTDYLTAGHPNWPDIDKRYVERLAALVDGAVVKRSKKETTWGAFKDDKIITVDALLADETREDAWVHAIAELQDAVEKRLPND